MCAFLVVRGQQLPTMHEANAYRVTPKNGDDGHRPHAKRAGQIAIVRAHPPRL
jgi:hypothetical protein